MRLKITFHGVESSSYWQGHGLPYWAKSTATGIGDTYLEALNDALESLTQEGFEVIDEEVEKALKEGWATSQNALEGSEPRERKSLHAECNAADDDCELHYWVSVDVGD